MISSRRPPGFMPTMPRSQPGMTAPAPSWKLNGWPLSHEASNCRPVDHDAPTYCISTVSPAFAACPSPTTMSSVWSSDGGSPLRLWIAGFSVRSALISPTGAAAPLADDDVLRLELGRRVAARLLDRRLLREVRADLADRRGAARGRALGRGLLRGGRLLRGGGLLLGRAFAARDEREAAGEQGEAG